MVETAAETRAEARGARGGGSVAHHPSLAGAGDAGACRGAVETSPEQDHVHRTCGVAQEP